MNALIELVLLLACLGLSWLIVHNIGKRFRSVDQQRSVLLGRHVFDGLLFPVVALLLALGARRVMPLIELPAALFKVVIPVLMSLVVIRFVARVLRAAFPSSLGTRLLERSVSWVAWLGSILWIIGVLPVVMDELDDIKLGWLAQKGTRAADAPSLLDVLQVGLQVGLLMIVVLWLSSAIESRMLRGKSIDLSMRKIVVNITRTVLLAVGALVALNMLGLNLSALSWLGGAVGVGLGFGLQKITSNYVSGFMILAERSLRIGDMVKVDNFEGRISDIKTRYTVIRALNGREAIVPNESLITTRVENLSLADPQVYVPTVVQVAYGTDLDALFPQLVEDIKRVPRVLSDPAPSVALSNFAADGLELTIGFWISDPHNGQGGVRSEVNLAILRLLNRLKIDIPFPQRVVRTVVETPAAEGTPASAAASVGESPSAPAPTTTAAAPPDAAPR
ncbi:mechanosensitive ion channel domain-containing protein [Mitsuaria sp. GD03876]|uniref:mechanosensitive ion channel family protein n=1 Tax=Mitsuaria sp. GD03876 TaxID=2975399 RepID=UPI002446EA2A|nr:mechanosensitive ion channel domain-containing protein [Mitsuaria sp. GD03876]MDH0865953.1 mechanosensitive ion channel [Mitsuaria sp. GD03876]